jgi:hypothetical protein
MVKRQRGKRASSPTRTRTRAEVSDDEIARQTAAARLRQAELRRDGRVATSARYDATSTRIVVELSNGTAFAVPVTAIRALEGAPQERLAEVQIDELGSGLRWESLDADVSVPGLLVSTFGPRTFAETGRRGGRARSEAKAAAARANGAKGGRPRKKAKRAAR